MKVRPGDNVTLYCDRSVTLGFRFVWIRNCSHENQPSLVIDLQKLDLETFQYFNFIYNRSSNSHDLHITNISASDLGLYYCAEIEIKVYKGDKGNLYSSEVNYFGNQTTHLSFAENNFVFWTLGHHLHTSSIRLCSLLDAAVQCVSGVCSPLLTPVLRVCVLPLSGSNCRLYALLQAAVQCVSCMCSPLLSLLFRQCVLSLSEENYR
ncbi:unnamed protein product [Leuciscus chuanchicus]